MAVIQTTVRTFFEDGRYRNNTVSIEIPDEAAEIIRKAWCENGVGKSVNALWLSKNQNADALLFMNSEDDEATAGIYGMCAKYTVDNEIITRKFTDDDEDDGDIFTE